MEGDFRCASEALTENLGGVASLDGPLHESHEWAQTRRQAEHRAIAAGSAPRRDAIEVSVGGLQQGL